MSTVIDTLSNVNRVEKLARRLYHSRLVPDRVREARRRRAARASLLSEITLPPTTFNEKVLFRMAKDRRSILTVFADKIAVREYVAERVGPQLLTQLYDVTTVPEELLAAHLPKEFVIKASHASGGVVVVAECADPASRLLEPQIGWTRCAVSPQSLDWNRLIELCKEWLARRYNPYEEWAYSKVKPRVLAEEFVSAHGGFPNDYRFFVFGGQVSMIQVEQDRFRSHTRNFYSPEWKLLEVEYGYPRGPAIPRPEKLEEMIAVAKQLADRIDFIRVDLYNVGERIVFGEITTYPVSGRAQFNPPEFDAQLGALWQMPRSRRGRLLHP